jgi:hypothetical protein
MRFSGRWKITLLYEVASFCFAGAYAPFSVFPYISTVIQRSAYIFDLKMEAKCYSETFVYLTATQLHCTSYLKTVIFKYIG